MCPPPRCSSRTFRHKRPSCCPSEPPHPTPDSWSPRPGATVPSFCDKNRVARNSGIRFLPLWNSLETPPSCVHRPLLLFIAELYSARPSRVGRYDKIPRAEGLSNTTYPHPLKAEVQGEGTGWLGACSPACRRVPALCVLTKQRQTSCLFLFL